MPPRRDAPRAGKDLLFTLIPQNDEAKAVVALNPNHVTTFLASHVLACYADRPSQIPGRLLSFGRNGNHDIRLPSESPFPRARNDNASGEKGVRGRRNYGNYRNDHFFFFLAPSGELILRDLSPCLVAIELEHSNSTEGYTYNLHGKNPRQRVIPRTTRSVFITFGTSTQFMMKWARGYQGEADDAELAVQSKLADKALALHMRGMSLTAPDEDTPMLTTMHHSHELRSRHTPSGGSSLAGKTRPIHTYGHLGSGTFGQVSKVVDLASGELWAVKEIKEDANRDGWKKSFLEEVEILLGLRHENIVHFETYQDFRIGGRYQLFFGLYKGNVHELITEQSQHSCDGPARDHDIQPSFWTRFIVQMCSAVEYLHGKGIVHRDIKPQNVMYDHVDGNDEVSFFLGDFGLSKTTAAMKRQAPGGGTPFYNAPELTSTNTPTTASDIWALGVMFGEARGYWCFREMGRSADFWNRKLAAYGCTNVVHRDPPMLEPQSNIYWPYRVLAFAQGTLIPVALARMMSKAAGGRPTAAHLTRTPIADFTESSRRPAVALNPEMMTGTRRAAVPASQVARNLAMNAVARELAMNAAAGLTHAPIQQRDPRHNHPQNAAVHGANAHMHIPPASQPVFQEFKTPTSSEMNNMVQGLKTPTSSELDNMFLYPQSDSHQVAAQRQPNPIPQHQPPPPRANTNARPPASGPPAGQPAPNGGMHRQAPQHGKQAQHAQHATNPRAAAPAPAAPRPPNPTNTRYTPQRPQPSGPAPVPNPRAATAAAAAAATAAPPPRAAAAGFPALRPAPGWTSYKSTVENTPRAVQQPQQQQRVARTTRPPAAGSRGGLGGGGGGRRAQETPQRR